MKRHTILVSAALLLAASPVFSKEVVCEFTSWKGAKTEEASISWVGTGFIADEKMLVLGKFTMEKNKARRKRL